MSHPALLIHINAICNIAASSGEKLCLNTTLTASLAQYHEQEIPTVFLIPEENVEFSHNEVYYYKNAQDKTDPIKLSPFLNPKNIRTYKNHLDKKLVIDNIGTACKDLKVSNFIFLTADHELVSLAEKKGWIANKIYWEGELEINDRLALEEKINAEMSAREIVQVFDIDGTIFLKEESEKEQKMIISQALVNDVNTLKNRGFIKLINRILSSRPDPLKWVQDACEEHKKTLQEIPAELEQIKFAYSSAAVKETLEKIIKFFILSNNSELIICAERFQQLDLEWVNYQEDYGETFPVLEKFSEMINLPLTLDEDCFTNGKQAKNISLETLIRKNPQAFYIYYENDAKHLQPARKLADKLAGEGINLQVVQSMEENHFVEWLENVVNNCMESSDESEGYDSEEILDEDVEINDETENNVAEDEKRSSRWNSSRKMALTWMKYMQNMPVKSTKPTPKVSADTEQNEADVRSITKGI